LADWTWRHSDDREALRLLRGRDEAAERWDAVVESCLRLVQVESGDEQLRVAESLLQACQRVGRPQAAIPGLEHVLAAQPESTAIFDRLTALYEKTGEKKKQADLLAWSAERTSD